MSNRGNLNLIIAVLFVVVLFMGVGLSYLSSRPVGNMIGIAPDTQTEEELANTASPSADTQEAVTIPVTFEPEDAFPPDLRAEITQKVVNPASDYSSMIFGQLPIESVKITQSQSGEDVTYSMLATRIDKSVVTTEIVHDGSGIAWWLPICDKFCVFPETFAQKYPRIVESYSK